MPRRSADQAASSRRNILARAADLASVEGLEGLTIGRLADALSMSKSGLFAYFGSKQDLQIAVVEAAAESFEQAVLSCAGRGLERLLGLASAWGLYLESGVYRGGCFFAAACTDFDDRPGRVRDRLAELTASWLEAIRSAGEEACEDGHFEADPAQVAFEIHAFLQAANWSFQLHGDAASFERAATAIDRVLAAAVTSAGRPLLRPVRPA